MPRDLDPTFSAALTNKVIYPVILVDLNLNNQTLHVWSGIGPLTWNGNTYTGVGTLGEVQPAQEDTVVQANGANVSLSGVDPTVLADALSDLQLGGTVTQWFGLLNPAMLTLIGQPACMFSGLMDAPTVTCGVPGPNGEPGRAIISIPLETRLAMLKEGQRKLYSRADQNLKYPNDTGFQYVEQENYLALIWQTG